jgi:hypothetical protein
MMPVDLQCTFLVGGAMAFIARRRLATASEEWMARTRTVVLVFSGIVFAPVWTYITLRWTGWETMYAWDLSTVPFLLVAAFLPAMGVTTLGGFWSTERLLAKGRTAAAVALNAVVAGSCVAIVGPRWDRFTFVGTVAQFDAGDRGNLLHSDFAVMMAIATVLVFGPAAVLIIHWLRDPADDPAAQVGPPTR